MANQDPFAAYVAPERPEEEPKKDPFSEFVVPEEGPAIEKPDPFAAYAAPEAAPERYRPTEQYPGEHEHLKSINAVSGREIQEIAAKNGVSPEDLRRIAPYWRVGVEEQAGQGAPMTDDMKKFAGYLGAAALDLPQFILKKSQDPKMRGAIDDLKELAETRKTGVQVGGEIAAGLLVPVGRAGKVAEAAATGAKGILGTLGKEAAVQAGIGAGIGGAAGLAGSKEEEELKGIATGAAGGTLLGAGLGLAVGGLKVSGQIVKSLGVPEKEAAELVAQVEKEMARPEVGAAIERGEARVAQVAQGEAPSIAIELDKKAVQAEVETLRADSSKVDKLLEANPDLVEYVERSAGRQLSEEEMLLLAAKRNVANREASDTIQFAKYLENLNLGPVKTAKEIEKAIEVPSLRKAGQYIEKWTKSSGRTPEFLKQEYRNFKTAQLVQDMNAEALKRGFKISSNEFTRQVRKYFRVRGQFKIIDNRNAGLTKLEMVGDQLVEADNLKNQTLNRVLNESATALDNSTKTGLRDLTVGQIEELERTGTTRFSSPEQQKAFQDLSQLFEKQRQDLGKAGVQIQKISEEKAKTYIPRMQVDDATTTGRLRARIQEIQEASGVSFDTHFDVEQMRRMQASAPQAYQELVQGLEYLSGRKIKRPETLSKFVNQALTVDGTARMMATKSARKAAGVVKARQEVGIPSFLRETDLNKLYVRWNAEAWKQAHWQKPLQELSKQRNLLAAKGDRAGVEYVDWYLKKLAGGEQGLARWASQTKARFVAGMTERASLAESEGRTKAAKVYRALSDNSDLTNLISGSMYGNLLGFNPKQAVYNLAQPFVTLLPELSLGGNGWAAAQVLKGYFRAIKAVRNPAAAREMLRPYMAVHLSDELTGAFRTGLEHGAAGRIVRGALDKYNQAALSLMQSSETMNRLASLHVADSIAEELLKKSSNANNFLKGVGAGYRKEFMDLVAAENAPLLQQRMRDYVIAKTMFHYSPLMTSQLGSYLGKLGSAFSTWPTTITADIVADFAKEGAAGGSYLFFKKYMAPLGVLTVLDNWTEANTTPEGRAYLGTQGFRGMAPVRAATDIASRGVISSPYMEDAFKAFADAASGDPEAWWKSMRKMGSTLVPGQSLMNLLEVTIPRLQGIEPERSK